MENFISILRCPITHLPLTKLFDQEVAELNKRVDQGEIVHAHGKRAIKTLVEVLKVQGKSYYYPVIDGIICLIPQLVLVDKSESTNSIRVEADDVKLQLQQFYDEVGWQKQDKHFIDAVESEDLRKVSREYITKCHRRVGQHLAPKGQYLLDVASGPIQYDAYLDYSASYQYRICADLSMEGLRQAQAKLKDKGLYVLCDMTALPFEINSVDAVVSLHTIYHIPKAQQANAFSEIYRVLKPERKMVVVYSWGPRSLLMLLFMFPWKVLAKIKSWLKPAKQQPGIYFYAHSYKWYLSEIKSRYPVRLNPWRSVNVPFLKTFCHRYLFGRWLLKLIYQLEEWFPHVFGRFGAYPMMVFEKK